MASTFFFTDILFLFVWQLRQENNLYKSSVMVTAGANQVTVKEPFCLFDGYFFHCD